VNSRLPSAVRGLSVSRQKDTPYSAIILNDSGVLARIDAQSRLQVPQHHLDSLGWDNSRENLALMAEILGSGVIRLVEESKMKGAFERLDASLAQQSETGDPADSELHRTFRDRYRQAHLLKKETRIRLPKAVISALLGDAPLPLRNSLDVYLERFSNGLEVYSLSARIARLERYSAETSIWN